MRGNPQYRTQFLRRERQNERQTGKQEGKRDGELRRWVQRCTARFTARGDGRESAPHWNRRSLRRPTALSIRRSVIPKGFATLFWTVPPRFPASGQPHKQFRSTSDDTHRAFHLKVSNSKGFHNTIPDSTTALSCLGPTT